MLRSQTQGIWDQFDNELVRGKTLGIVGYGDIGRAVAERAHPLGMRILSARRRPERSANDPLIEHAFPSEARRELMAASDYVVVAAPLTPQTRGSIGEAEIGCLKPEAVLINIGRGPVVDERALVRALDEKRIRGAALDVFEREPLPAGHPFYRLENVTRRAGWRARWRSSWPTSSASARACRYATWWTSGADTSLFPLARRRSIVHWAD
jgi:phosphoglycerate dehydrogenase-like enzyme